MRSIHHGRPHEGSGDDGNDSVSFDGSGVAHSGSINSDPSLLGSALFLHFKAPLGWTATRFDRNCAPETLYSDRQLIDLMSLLCC